MPIRTFSPTTKFSPLKVLSEGKVPTTALFLATGREKVLSTTFSPVTTFPSQTGGKVPTRHLSRPRRGANQAFFPLEGKIQNRKKKSFHTVTTVGRLSSRATFLSHRQDKVRVRPYPDFFFMNNLHMQMNWIFWSSSRGHVSKGQEWACIFEFGTPRFRKSDPTMRLSDLYACAKNLPRSKTPFVAPLGSKSQL